MSDDLKSIDIDNLIFSAQEEIISFGRFTAVTCRNLMAVIGGMRNAQIEMNTRTESTKEQDDCEACIKSQQAEIERLNKTGGINKAKVEVLEEQRDKLKAENEELEDTIDSQGFELMQLQENIRSENESRRCCGNCGFFYPSTVTCHDGCKKENPHHRTLGNLKCDNWQPKENN